MLFFYRHFFVFLFFFLLDATGEETVAGGSIDTGSSVTTFFSFFQFFSFSFVIA